MPDSPAAAAGLQSGESLLRVNDRPARGLEVREAIAPLDGTSPAPVELTVARDGVERRVRITPQPAAQDAPPLVGVQPLPRIVSGLRPGLPLVAALGLQHGDIVLAVDGIPFRSPDLAVAQRGPERLTLHVRRGEEERSLSAQASAEDRQRLRDHVALLPDFDGLVVTPTPDGAAGEARACCPATGWWRSTVAH